MCGIAGFVGDCDATRIIVAMLKCLEYRGYDSAGIATTDGGRIHLYRKVGTIATDDKEALSLHGNAGIGHTRWATHGRVSVQNAHPHLSCNRQIAVVHNGTIMNYRELKKELQELEHVFRSETDTEVIPHLLEAISAEGAVNRLEGDFATLVLDTRNKELVAVKRGCPLHMTETEYGTMVASDTVAFDVLPHADIITLEDNKAVRIRIKTPSNLAAPPTPIRINTDTSTTHHMLREIQEQPEMLKRIAETADHHHLMQTVVDLLRADHILFTASGTSRYASLIGRYIISKGTERLSQVIAASEFRYFADGVRRGMAVVAVSQSGETADVLAGVRAVKDKGARIIVITNFPESTLGRLADKVIGLNCGREVGVAATKTFTAQLAVFYLLLGAMMGRLDETRRELVGVAEAVRQTIEQNQETVDTLAEKVSKEHDFYYLGRGINFAVAGEAALKMKEVSYVHAEGMAAGELKHGTLALVDEGTMVCGICPEDYTHPEMTVNMEEVRARKGIVIGITDGTGEGLDYQLRIPKVPEIYYPMVCIIPAQMLAYWTAVKKGLSPDFPKNLAKSVTVL